MCPVGHVPGPAGNRQSAPNFLHPGHRKTPDRTRARYPSVLRARRRQVARRTRLLLATEQVLVSTTGGNGGARIAVNSKGRAHNRSRTYTSHQENKQHWYSIFACYVTKTTKCDTKCGAAPSEWHRTRIRHFFGSFVLSSFPKEDLEGGRRRKEDGGFTNGLYAVLLCTPYPALHGIRSITYSSISVFQGYSSKCD